MVGYVGDNTKDLEELLHVQRVTSSIAEKRDRIKKMRFQAEDHRKGEVKVTIIEGEDPEGKKIVLFALADHPDCEGVAVDKDHIEKGLITAQQACHQLCIMAGIGRPIDEN